MSSSVEEPILSRINRLDNILKHLEEIRGHHHSPRTSYSYASITSSDGHPSFADHLSPDRLEKRCRPLHEVMMEVEEKGTLIERLLHAEDRILKMCLQLEEEFEAERSRELNGSAEKKSPKKSLKQLMKSCVRVKPKHKN